MNDVDKTDGRDQSVHLDTIIILTSDPVDESIPIELEVGNRCLEKVDEAEGHEVCAAETCQAKQLLSFFQQILGRNILNLHQLVLVANEC